MSTSDRLLFIHAGGGKTGSSALQSALAEAEPKLAAIGLAYGHAPQTDSVYTITSGNGLPLFSLLHKSDWDVKGKDLLESYLGHQTTGICSGEHLAMLSEDGWRKLIGTAAECGIQVRVIFFVRSAVSYLTACYNQEVKRAGECRELAEFLRDGTWHHYDSLRILDRVFADEHLKIINYDVARRDIVASFANAFPELVPAMAVMDGSAMRTVNRSLDAVEIEVMRRVNARFGGSFSEELSDRFIYEDPERRGGLTVSPEIAADLKLKFEEQTCWVNERFFDGQGARLQDLAPSNTLANPANFTNPFSIALDWALERLDENGGDAIGHVRDQLLKIDWQNSDHREIPNDFDPIAYLLLNNDLIRAGVKPFRHYIDSGKREGRTYHWPLLLDTTGNPSVAAPVIEARRTEGRNQEADPRAYLRQLYQVEGLIHSFAERERSWLNELRREREAGKYARAELQNIVSELSETVISTLQQSIDALASRQDEHSSQIAGLSDHFSLSTDAQAGMLRQQGDQVGVAMSGITEQLNSLLQAATEERSRLANKVDQHEAEIRDQEQALARYRTAGVWEFIGWSLNQRKRP